jgi:hypothetical protein
MQDTQKMEGRIEAPFAIVTELPQSGQAAT